MKNIVTRVDAWEIVLAVVVVLFFCWLVYSFWKEPSGSNKEKKPKETKSKQSPTGININIGSNAGSTQADNGEHK